MRFGAGRSLTAIVTAFVGAATALAQRPRVDVETLHEGEALSPIWFVFAALSLAAIIAFVADMRRRRRIESERADAIERQRRKRTAPADAIDADREANWARKRAAKSAKPSIRKAPKEVPTARPEPETPPRFGPASPVFNIDRIELARPFHPLPAANDEFLLDAIDQLSEDYLEDLEARDLALNVLKKFRTSNAIEALAEVALYDLSATLRAKAVSILTEFDHESVFETLVVACADPSREVMAAAARGIFRLSIDRREAWLRLAQMSDASRRRRAARAVAVSDFPQRAIERLTRPEREHVLEAVALLYLLAAEGETRPITDAIDRHSGDEIGLPLVHVIGVLDNQQLYDHLENLCRQPGISRELSEKIETVLERVLN